MRHKRFCLIELSGIFNHGIDHVFSLCEVHSVHSIFSILHHPREPFAHLPVTEALSGSSSVFPVFWLIRQLQFYPLCKFNSSHCWQKRQYNISTYEALSLSIHSVDNWKEISGHKKIVEWKDTKITRLLGSPRIFNLIGSLAILHYFPFSKTYFSKFCIVS